MNCVIVGPSDRSVLWRYGSVLESGYDSFVAAYGKFLAEHFEDVFITPDSGVYSDIALAFSEHSGRKAIAYYPDKDVDYGFVHLEKNFSKFDTRKADCDWYQLSALLMKRAMTVICVGYSPGTFIEIAYLKFHQKYGKFNDASLADIRLLIDKRCIDQELPRVFHEQINNISYFADLAALDVLLQQR